MEDGGTRRLCLQFFLFMWDLGHGVRVTAGIMNILEAPEPGHGSTRSGLDTHLCEITKRIQ